MVVDFQSHINKKGTFILGNEICESDMLNESMMLVPKLMSINCTNFDFKECIYESGIATDTFRSVIFRETGINPYIYTLSTSFTCGSVLNTLPLRFDMNK